jgi:hypothetical protein
MSDDRANRGGQDRSRVAGDQDYEVRYFADRHGISMDQARKLIAEHGNSRAALDAAAEKLAKA